MSRNSPIKARRFRGSWRDSTPPVVAAGEATVLPNIGLVTVVGQIPGEYRELNQGLGVGLVATGTLAPLISGWTFPGVGLVATVEQVPGEYRELNQGVGVGLVSTVGQIPGEYRELNQSVGVGLVSTVGQVPGEYRELNQAVGVGSAVTIGQVPALLRDGALGPAQSPLSLSGLAPTLYTELVQQVGVGLAIIEGRQPTVDTGAGVVEGTALPEVGLVTAAGQIPDEYRELNQDGGVGSLVIEGLVPTLVGTTGDIRGHAKTRTRDYGRAYIPEVTISAVAALAVQPPPVFVDPPHSSFVVDTAAVSAKVTRLEVRRARIARMRREEEELIAILMRAA